MLLLGVLRAEVLSILNVHVKHEDASFAHAIRLHADGAFAHLNDLLCNHEPKANSLAVLGSCSLEFTKEAEQVWHVFRAYSYSSVFYFDMQSLQVAIVRNNHLNCS